LSNNGIKTIDLRDYLVSIADTSRYPIYPKGSIHISAYASYLSADTLIKFINKNFDADIPDLSADFEESKTPRYYDNDIVAGSNLLFPPIYNQTFVYPQIKFSNKTGKLKIATIGDSFYKYIHLSGIHKRYFRTDKYWFYGKLNWPDMSSIFDNKDFRADFITNTDIILFFITDATMYLFPYEFTKSIAEHIFPFDEKLLEKYYFLGVSADKEWLKLVTDKAKKNNISVEEQKLRDAKYMAKEYLSHLKGNDKKLYNIYKSIKSDPKWFEIVNNKAKQNNISVEYATMLDAIYILNQTKNTEK
jgi:hypothetical protein